MSTGFNIQTGEPIVLRLLLPESDNTKFVRAIVKDEDGNVLTGSPFTLNNIGDGEYYFKDAVNLLFPEGKLEIFAIYEIYDDNGFTIPTCDYSHRVGDVFRRLNTTSNDIETVINRLNKIINSLIPTDAEIDVTEISQLSLEVTSESNIELDISSPANAELNAQSESNIELEPENQPDIEIETSS
jgi:hypothetical protein